MNLRAAGRSIRITHPDRIVFPALGVTKGEVVDYHRALASAMLPWAGMASHACSLSAARRWLDPQP